MMVEAGKLVEGRLVTTVEEGRRGWEGCTVASWAWDSLGDGLKESKITNKKNQRPTNCNYKFLHNPQEITLREPCQQ